MRPRSVFHGGVLGLAAVTAPIHPALPGQPGDPADRLLRLRALAHRLELEGAAAGESVVSNGSPTLSRSPDFPHSPLPSPRSHLTPAPLPSQSREAASFNLRSSQRRRAGAATIGAPRGGGR